MKQTKVKKFPVGDLEADAAAVSGDFGADYPEPFQDLIDSFQIHTWVYACANLIANAFASIDFLPYTRNGDAWDVDERHPFFELLQNPNPMMSGVEFKRLLSLSSKLTGNAFIVCDPAQSKQPKELWPLQPHKVKVVPDRQEFIGKYVYEVNGHSRPLDKESIIHFREATPTNLQYGQGSLSAVKNSVMTDIYADTWNRYFFQNAGRPDAILEGESNMDEKTQKRVAKAWIDTFSGTKNRARVAVLSGLKYHETNRAHKDMDFVNLRKMLREEILAAFGVPQSMVGILDQANYSNMKEQTKVFWTQTMIPEIRKFESIMTLRARQITGNQKTIIQADLSKVEALRADEQARASVAQTYFNMGIPLAQIVTALDLPFDIDELPEPKKEKPGEDTPDTPDTEDDGQDQAKGKRAKALETKGDVRAMIWKKFDRDVRPFEQGMESKMRAYFKAQRRRVLKKFDEHVDALIPRDGKGVKTDEDNVGLIFNFDVEKSLFGKSAEPWLRKTWAAFSIRTAERMRSGVRFDVDERALGDWLARKVLKLQQEVTVYTREQLSDEIVAGVRDAVAAGLSRSETIEQIRAGIEEVYEFAAEGRATRIARTEVIGAANAGSIETMKKLGAVAKEWLSSRDDLVRDTHEAMDGQRVKMNEPFISPDGESLQYPGDPSASPGEIINCRCTPLEIMEE